MQKNELKAIIISFLAIITISCNDSSKKENISLGKETPIYIKFQFPDTIKVNKSYDGKIKYSGYLDTITKSFYDQKKSRYISLYMVKTSNIDYDTEELYEKKLDTFGAIDNNTIPFYDIKFTKKGIYFLDGIINDHVSIDTISKNRKSTDKIRYIENVVRINHKIVVIE